MVCKMFFAQNSTIFRKSLDEERKQISKELQSFMLYKQKQKSYFILDVFKFFYFKPFDQHTCHYKILKIGFRPKNYIAWKVFIFGVILVGIQFECGKTPTRITPNTDTFYAVLVQANQLDLASRGYSVL